MLIREKYEKEKRGNGYFKMAQISDLSHSKEN